MNNGSGAMHDDMLRRVLFLCGGNYDSSRVCEELFNDQATRRRLSWTAFSRALMPHPAQLCPGPMCPQAVHLLLEAGVAARNALRLPLEVSDIDLMFSSVVVNIVDDANRTPAEARVLSDALSTGNRVEHWHIEQSDRTTPRVTFDRLQRQTRQLVERISVGQRFNNAA